LRASSTAKDLIAAEVKAVNRAETYNQPLRMSDLPKDYVSHE
jgi:hypothetical protein